MKKKLLILLFSVIILITSTLNLTAEAYVKSIEFKSDVYIQGATTDGYSYFIEQKQSDGCDVEAVLTPYIYRDRIQKESSKVAIEAAYQSIVNAGSVVEAAPVLKGYGGNFGILDDCMIVSNIFDLSTYVHEGGAHAPGTDHSKVYNVTIGAESLQYFICLLHYDVNSGQWEIVKDCKKVSDDTIQFTWNCSPFAIVACGSAGSCRLDYKGVVNTKAGEDVVASTNNNSCSCFLHIGDTCLCWIPIALLVVSAILNVYLLLEKKNNKNNNE